MNINIVKVESRKQLKLFVTFPLHLYKDCANWVPALEGDEYDTFNPKKNGAYDFCEADCFLAYRGDEIVGRVAAIINHKATNEQHIVRFGWLDFIEDEEVLKALIDTVEREEAGRVLEKLGFTKEVDWTQRTLEVSKTLPKMFEFSKLIEDRFHVHVVQPKSMNDMCKRYGMEIFHMYNEAFAPLHGFSPLTDKQIDSYLKTYVPILDKDFVAVAVNDKDQPIGFLFCVPSLSKAVKKSNGRLFPFGFIRIMKALKKNDTLEALIMGVLPEYQQCGIPMLMFKYLHENCIKRGIDTIIMNPQLEENYKVQSLFGEYITHPFMRRRAYKRHM